MAVFRRDSKLREFEICDRLEKEAAAIWAEIRRSPTGTDLTDMVQLVFDHYERCAVYLNQFKMFKGRAARALEQSIFEVVQKQISRKPVTDALKICRTSTETYKELRALLEKRNVYIPVGI